MNDRDLPAPDEREAEIIRLCARRIGLWHERAAIAEGDPRAPDRGPLHSRYDAMFTKDTAAARRLLELGAPTTPGGKTIMARLALLHWQTLSDGSLMVETNWEWLTAMSLQSIAGSAIPITAGETLRYHLGLPDEAGEAPNA